jgi:HupE / UreJ protein
MDLTTVTTYLKHGIHHVLMGWDHLLFAAALILALRRFWDVFKIIGVFTIAHSITVTVTALRGEPLFAASIVEPIIAASIIIVALENMVLPPRSVTGRRLAIAFGFGLVHGLGLGGALLENMAEVPRSAIGWAIAAFCIGVEIGHLCIVAPLSGILKAGRDAGGENFHNGALYWGSLVIALGGTYYLLAALGVLPGIGE